MLVESKSYVVNTFESHVRITLQKLTLELRQEVTLELRQETTYKNHTNGNKKNT